VFHFATLWQCIPDCEGGMQTRSVICVDITRGNALIDDRFCNAAAEPVQQQSCGVGPCDATVWFRGEWSMVRSFLLNYMVTTISYTFVCSVPELARPDIRVVRCIVR